MKSNHTGQPNFTLDFPLVSTEPLRNNKYFLKFLPQEGKRLFPDFQPRVTILIKNQIQPFQTQPSSNLQIRLPAPHLQEPSGSVLFTKYDGFFFPSTFPPGGEAGKSPPSSPRDREARSHLHAPPANARRPLLTPNRTGRVRTVWRGQDRSVRGPGPSARPAREISPARRRGGWSGAGGPGGRGAEGPRGPEIPQRRRRGRERAGKGAKGGTWEPKGEARARAGPWTAARRTGQDRAGQRGASAGPGRGGARRGRSAG